MPKVTKEQRKKIIELQTRYFALLMKQNHMDASDICHLNDVGDFYRLLHRHMATDEPNSGLVDESLKMLGDMLTTFENRAQKSKHVNESASYDENHKLAENLIGQLKTEIQSNEAGGVSVDELFASLDEVLTALEKRVGGTQSASASSSHGSANTNTRLSNLMESMTEKTTTTNSSNSSHTAGKKNTPKND